MNTYKNKQLVNNGLLAGGFFHTIRQNHGLVIFGRICALGLVPA
jgi:hypothetical protein